jgi:hypothetical protein
MRSASRKIRKDFSRSYRQSFVPPRVLLSNCDTLKGLQIIPAGELPRLKNDLHFALLATLSAISYYLVNAFHGANRVFSSSLKDKSCGNDLVG